MTNQLVAVRAPVRACPTVPDPAATFEYALLTWKAREMPKLKGAFAGCEWCGGNGCMCCDGERQKAVSRAHEPIFTANPDSPEDMALLKDVVGREALEKAFGFDGGGMAEINRHAAEARLKQALRTHFEEVRTRP